MSMSGYFDMVLGGTLIMVTLGALGFYTFATGSGEQRRLAARGMLDDAERVANGPLARFDTRLRRTELGRYVGRRIAAAGLKVRVSTFLLLMIVAAIVAVFAIGNFLAPIFGVASALGVAAVFFGYLRRQEDRRREAFIGQLPELARVLSNATSAGLAIRTAVGMAADELDEPARTELRRTADSLAYGQSFDTAMNELQARLPSRELAVLVSTLVVSSRAGGSLVTALRNISGTLEERKEIHRETKTIMGEAVTSGWAVSLMGVGMLVIINVIQPGSVERMTESLLGLAVLVLSFSLFGAGLFIIRKITKIEV